MRRFRRWAWLPAATLLAGCVTTGESTVEAELQRRRGEERVIVAEAAPDRAVFIAKGERVIVEPPTGYCLDENSITENGSAAFTMIAECLNDQDLAKQDGGDGQEVVEIKLPPAFPGILTISISAQPAFGTSPPALSEFEALLTSKEGLTLLGRGTGKAPGRVMAMRRIGNAVYVLVEGQNTAGGILSPRFWRAFAGIKDRLVLVTVSGFRDGAVSDDSMLGFLVRQMRRLRRANQMPVVPEETKIIETMAAGDPVPGQAEIVLAEPASDTGAQGIAPASAPRPDRPDRVVSRSEATRIAPASAPRAPVKPDRSG